MTHALESYNGTISIGGCNITNLRFADGNDGITGEENELTKFEQNLDTAATKFGMKIIFYLINDDKNQWHFTKRHHYRGAEVRNSVPLQIPRCHNL